MRVKWIFRCLCAGVVLAGTAFGSAVTVKLGSAPSGAEIPDDFVGLSFETSNLLPGKDGRYIFNADDEKLVGLFRTIGIKNLRVGGGTAEISNYSVPGPAEIDRLFAFARVAGVRVIYTLRLLSGNKTQAAALARHLTTRHADQLECLSIGNEPDWHSYHTRDPEIFETTPGVPGTAYASFLAKWRDFAAAIVRDAPEAKFGGPDTGSNHPVQGAKDTDSDGKSWTERFVADEKGSGRLLTAFHHDYVGQEAEGVSVAAAIDAMLSREWLATRHTALRDHVLAPVQALGLPYRMTECNDHTGGVDGASNAFVSALWALDYMHWHAANGARGVNFHNKRWIYTCTIIQDSAGAFHMNPKGYGLKAFSLGSRGRVEPIELVNAENINLTAYAVRGAHDHFVTLINKEHGRSARAAEVTVVLPPRAGPTEVIFLTAPNNDPGAKTGVTLGGAPIGDDGSWAGKWMALSAGPAGSRVVTVPPTAAAIVKISSL
jgi:hypothetical protein